MVILGNRVNMTWNDLLEAAHTSKLPGDLIIQILLRLPVKSILRFKSVSRAWYFVIKSPIFIQHRRALSSSSNQNQLSLFVHTKEGNSHIFSWVLEPRSFGDGEPVLINLKPPFDEEDVAVVGSINGLVCFTLCSDAADIILWNPALRMHYHIPKAELWLEDDERVSVGFGYDEKTDFYKVFRILYSKDSPQPLTKNPVRVEIFSTGTGTWRTKLIGHFPWLDDLTTCATIVLGAPFWYGYAYASQKEKINEHVIIWFDASKETFGYVPSPVGYIRKIGLGVVGEQPVVFAQCWTVRPQYDDDLSWLETWKLITCEDGVRVVDFVENQAILTHTSVERILGFWGNGKIIALDKNGELVINDPRSYKIRYVPKHGSSSVTKVCEYTDTLIIPLRVA